MKLIAILSCKYSGSTITDFMLGAHDQVLSLTELYSFVANNRKPFACKSCQPPESCPVWTPELTQKLVSIGTSKDLYTEIERVTGYPVLVDSSKLIDGWFALTLKGMTPSDVTFVHLSKSPEEYAGSEKNKSHVSSLHQIDDIADRWWRQNGAILDFVGDYGAGGDPHIVTVRYRDVIDHAPLVLDSILSQVGLGYRDGIENYWNFEQHPLWGNKGARSHFDSTDSHPERWTDESETQKRLYTEQHQTLFRDEKWRDTLTRAEVDRLWANPRVVRIAALLGYAHPFTDEGMRLNVPTSTWMPRSVIGTAAAQERRDRHGDVIGWEFVVKVRRKLRNLVAAAGGFEPPAREKL